MNANRFFSIPYDNRNDITIRVMKKRMGGIAAYGRWVSLLGMLYDADGVLDMSDQCVVEIVADELELTDVDEYFTQLASLGLIEADRYHAKSLVINRGVCDELEYRKTRSEVGKMGGRPKKPKTET